MTQPGIRPQSPRPSANTLIIMPMGQFYLSIYLSIKHKSTRAVFAALLSVSFRFIIITHSHFNKFLLYNHWAFTLNSLQTHSCRTNIFKALSHLFHFNSQACRLRLHNTPIGSLQRGKTPPTSGPVGWGYKIHRLDLCKGVKLPQRVAQSAGGCRIHRLRFCWGVKRPQRVSWIWRQTIWWWGSCNARALGNAEYPFIAIAPRPTLTRNGRTW